MPPIGHGWGMGEARHLRLCILLFCILIPAAPLAAAAPTCADQGIARACADPSTEAPVASADTVILATGSGSVPAMHADASAQTASSTAEANATSRADGWRWSLDAKEDGARVCGFASVTGSTWVDFGCTDPDEPPNPSTDPNAWVGLVAGVPGAVLGALPCRVSGRTLVC